MTTFELTRHPLLQRGFRSVESHARETEHGGPCVGMRWCRQLHARTRRQEGHGRDQLPSKHCVHGLTSFSVAFCFPLFGSTCLFTLGEAHSDLQELLAQATSLETAALLTTSGTASSLKEKLASTVAREEKSIIERARTALQGTNLSSSRPCDLKTAVGPLMIAVSPQTVAHAART